MDIFEELNDVFQEVESQAGEFEELPDGEYLAEIQSAEYKESKSGNPMVQIATQVTYGDYEGRYHSRFMLLNGKDDKMLRRNLNALARQAKDLGVDTSKGLQETIKGLEELEGKEVKVKIETVKAKNGNEYTNTYIHELDE